MKALILLSGILLPFCLWISLVPGPSVSPATSDSSRFIIRVDGKVGYIDGAGRIVIEPTFESGHEFSEGLCAVRSNGLYGFINTDGDFVIEPEFDYATQFVEGVALTFIDGKPVFVDKQGNDLFKSVYKSMRPFRGGRSQVMTYSGKVGIVDKAGRLVIDTVYSRIGDFADGLAVAYGFEHQAYSSTEKENSFQATIIDSQGNRILPYGKYAEIVDSGEGYFRASTAHKFSSNSRESLLDRKGNVIYTLPKTSKNEYSEFEGNVCNGIIRASIPSRNQVEKNNRDVYMTTKGKIVFENVTQRWTRDFSCNRAFIQNDDRTWSIINRNGKVVSDQTYDNVLMDGYYDGKAYVQTNDGWGAIDTLGSFIVPPKFGQIHDASIGTEFIFFADTVTDDEKQIYGIADRYGNVILKPTFEQFDERGFVNGLLHTYIEERSAYINMKGKIVWQEEPGMQADLRPLNIDYMNRGYFYASSYSAGHSADGRRAQAQLITKANDFSEDTFSLVAVPGRQYEMPSTIQTMTVFVVNPTKDTVRFNARDGRLYMKMQAMDKHSVWRDIEYLPNSWCGNSYHILSLAPGHYWSFPAPVYHGAFETKLRVELKVIGRGAGRDDRRYREKDEVTYYSNEFIGSINPGQFWRRPGYTSMGIMDPYWE